MKGYGRVKKAEAERKARGEFLSKISHEIRTPMNVIAGLSELTCKTPDLPPGVEENLQKIRLSSQYLLTLLSNLLDMSEIENGTMTIQVQPFSLSSLSRELDCMIQVQAQQKKITFETKCSIQHDIAEGDKARIEQVLVNLLSNALKFTPEEGKVWLDITEQQFDGKKAGYLFSVKDNGVGIEPEFRSKMYEVFEQVHHNMSKSEGAGLGLPISYHMVRLMGGELKLNENREDGAEFYFRLELPAGETILSEKKPADTIPTGKCRNVYILLAEDNELNAEIADDFLNLWGANTEWALNGKQAVDLFLASEEGHYQLILLDIQMPVKSGLDVARDIRSSGRADSDVPIIAMSANVFRADIQAAREAGMNDFVPKPVDFDYLYEIIARNL